MSNDVINDVYYVLQLSLIRMAEIRHNSCLRMTTTVAKLHAESIISIVPNAIHC